MKTTASPLLALATRRVPIYVQVEIAEANPLNRTPLLTGAQSKRRRWK